MLGIDISEIETVEMHHHEYTVQTQNTVPTPPYPAIEKISILSSDFNDVFHVFCDNLKSFAYSLDNPLSVVNLKIDIDWTIKYDTWKSSPFGIGETQDLRTVCGIHPFAISIHIQSSV